MNEYTVIGYYEESGQIFSHHVNAATPYQAFYLTAQSNNEAMFISCLAGHIKEGVDTIEFAGESVVSAVTVLSQPEVFNQAGDESVSDIQADAKADVQGEGLPPIDENEIKRMALGAVWDMGDIFYDVGSDEECTDPSQIACMRVEEALKALLNRLQQSPGE